jgi:hypothetical protein
MEAQSSKRTSLTSFTYASNPARRTKFVRVGPDLDEIGLDELEIAGIRSDLSAMTVGCANPKIR